MIRVVLSLLLGYLIITGLSPYRSGGPAAVNGIGYTGAPCDDFRTCRGCHLQSFTYGPTTEEFRLLDPSTGASVSHYTPGMTYDVEIEVFKSRGGFALYGFQATAIGEDSLDIGSWLQPGNQSTIVQISNTCNSPRTYVEHNMPSLSNVFTMKWQAPITNSGIASFYVSSNVANGNGNESGDSGSPGSVYRFFPPPPSHLILRDSITSREYLATDSITALAPFYGQSEVIFRSSSIKLDSAFSVPHSSTLEAVIDSL